MRDYYTIGEVAYLLKVSRSTVSKWIREGKLKAFITNGVTEDEWDFDDRLSNSVKKSLCYAIKPGWDYGSIYNQIRTERSS